MPARIVVVDDELDIRIFIRTLLESRGYKVKVAENGLEGFEIAKKKKPDLIIMDVMMPKESGVNLYRAVKTDPELKDVPVLIVSAVSKKTFLHSQRVLNEHEGLSVPEPDDYIEKPPETEELLEHVGRLVD